MGNLKFGPVLLCEWQKVPKQIFWGSGFFVCFGFVVLGFFLRKSCRIYKMLVN